MQLHQLTTENFRNLATSNLGFAPGSTIITGPNGAGKTNILEAVVVAAAAYSFRTRTLPELCTFDTNRFRTAATLEAESGLTVEASSTMPDTGRIKHKVVPEVTIPVTVFTPDDLRIIKGGPGQRRMYLDQVLFTTSATYRHNWQRYRSLHAQRNSLLKQMRSTRPSHREHHDELEAWDVQLVQAGAQICRARDLVCTDLQQHVSHIHRVITGDPVPVVLAYRPAIVSQSGNPPVTVEQWSTALAGSLVATRERDLRTATTGAGPHRDELEITLGGKTVRDYGSQGQQRTLSLSLRLAQHLVSEQVAGERGILLLDDVASELDYRRRSRLGDVTEGRQIIITTTDHSLFPPPDLLLRVQGGTVISQ